MPRNEPCTRSLFQIQGRKFLSQPNLGQTTSLAGSLRLS
jgi:hypothetical protein